MQVREDPGARRNRGEGGLWTMNFLVSTLVAALSLYVLQPDGARQQVRAVVGMVAALPGQIAATPARAASLRD